MELLEVEKKVEEVWEGKKWGVMPSDVTVGWKAEEGRKGKAG
jgi:hypothetical protein